MTEAEWLASADPTPMLEFLWGKASDRKLRLFAVACCRHVWALLGDRRSRRAIEVAELFADGAADAESLFAAKAIAADAVAELACIRPPIEQVPWAAADSARSAVNNVADEAARLSARHAAQAVLLLTSTPDDEAGEPVFQATTIRCIFGNPFRPSPPPPFVLPWNDETVLDLAHSIYEDRQMPEGTLDTSRLAILADALLDTGCDNEDLILHCRSQGPHVRGCWAIDLILGKQ